MKKINDRIIAGTTSGIVTSIPFQVSDALFYKYRITDVPYGLSSSKIFLTKKAAKTPAGQTLSLLANFVNAGITGTFITYALSITGKDYAITKGAGIGSLTWVGIAGLVSNLGLKIRSKKPVTPWINYFENILFGASTAYMITKIGDDSLFPNNINKQKIPIVGTTPNSN
ncbi:MAG: hypothetical protein K9L17_04680 [Clostridiales bacterium]|nr:hypothetical protein [Clostridiales bacterium]MCF8021970.1 hypothetical protein [Clostridiales bacterium]